MKKFIVIFGILFLFSIFYNNFSFNKYMEEGKEAVINEEFGKAKDLFQRAVNKKNEDREARALYKQSQILIEVLKLKEENNFQDAIDLCQNINNTDSEDNRIKRFAEKLKNECNNKLKKLNEYEDSLNIRINEGKAFMSGGNYDKAKTIFNEIINEIENLDDYYLHLDEVKNYLSILEEQ